MSKKQVLQAGGSKEAPIAVVGSSGLVGDPQREQVFTPDHAEFQYYTELLSGYFDLLGKWREIFAEYTKPESKGNGYILPTTYPSPYLYPFDGEINFQLDTHSGFHVLDTPQGLTRVPQLPHDAPESTYDVLLASMRTGQGDTVFPHATMTNMAFNQNHLGERKLLTDLHGEKPTSVEVVVCDIPGRLGLKYLTVTEDIASGSQNVRYRLAPENFTVTRGYKDYINHKPMSDENATHLLTTIDNLIPGAPATPKSGRRAGHELVPLRLLPAPSRRPAGR